MMVESNIHMLEFYRLTFKAKKQMNNQEEKKEYVLEVIKKY